MLEISHADASAAILAHVAEGRLTQRRWHDRAEDGREIACLLGAIHPSVTSPAKCNGALMPMWLAEMVPRLFDGLSADRIYPIAQRFGELVGRWHVLSAAQWEIVLKRVRIRCIDVSVEAARSVAADEPYWEQLESACTQCRRAIEAAEAAEAARDAARDAGDAAEAAEAARDAARDAGDAAWAARAAAWAAWAARDAARDAARAAGDAAWAAGAAAWAARAAGAAAWAARAAGSAAYDRLFTFVLDQIEAEIA